jgi:hypothetical protein
MFVKRCTGRELQLTISIIKNKQYISIFTILLFQNTLIFKNNLKYFLKHIYVFPALLNLTFTKINILFLPNDN